MPIISVPGPTPTGMENDNWFDPFLAPGARRTKPGWGELAVATARTTSWKGIYDWVNEPQDGAAPLGVVRTSARTGYFTPDAGFSQFHVYDHIRAQPDLKDDPQVAYLYERGQFDDADTEDEFNFALRNGRDFIRDAQTIRESSSPLAWQLAGGVFDPINVGTIALAAVAAPFTGGASLLAGAGTLETVGASAAVGAASNLASQRFQAALQPVSNEPGLSDELTAAAIGGGLGAGFGWLHASMKPLGQGIPSAKLARINRGIEELARGELPDNLVGKTPMAVDAAERAAQRPPVPVAPVADAGTPSDIAPPPAPVIVSSAATPEPKTPSVVDVQATPRERVRAYARDRMSREPFADSNTVDVVVKDAAETFGLTPSRVRGWVEKVAEKVRQEQTEARGAETPYTVLDQPRENALAEEAAAAGAPPEMAIGLDRAAMSVDTMDLPASRPGRPDVERSPLDAEDFARAEAIQAAIESRRGHAKTFGGSRPGFVFFPFARSKPKTNATHSRQTPTLTIDEQHVHELDGGYIPFLAATPEAHRTMYTLNNATPEITQAMDDIRAKYQAAGVPLNEVVHPLQAYTDLINQARLLTRMIAANLPASAISLGLSKIGQMVTGGEQAVNRALISPMTPAGRLGATGASVNLPDALADGVQRVFRTISGSASTVSEGSASSPFTFRAPQVAEAMKDIATHRKDMTLLSIRDTYRTATRAAREKRTGPLQYGNSRISLRLGYLDFKRAVTDYYHGMNSAEAGSGWKPPANTDQSIIDAADTARLFWTEQGNRMKNVGMLRDAADVSVLDARLKRRNTLTAKLESKLAAERAAPVPDPARIASAADRVRKSRTVRDSLAERRRFAKADAAREKWFMPRTYDVPMIRARKDNFQTELQRAARQAHDVRPDGTRAINEDHRALRPSVADRLDKKALEAAVQVDDPTFTLAIDTDIRKVIAGMSEGDLPLPLRQAYRDHLQAEYQAKSAAAYDSIAGAKGNGANQLAGRTMDDFDETILGPWMERDIETLLNRSHNAIDGRWAIRKAIKENPELSNARNADGTPLTTEDDLIKHATRLPELLLERMAAHNDVSDMGVRRALDKFIYKAKRDLTGMVDLLANRHPASPFSVLPGMEFMGRQVLALEYMNKMGTAVLNTFNDIAPMTIYTATHPRVWRHIPAAVLNLKSATTRELDLISGAVSDLHRAQAFADLLGEPTGGFGAEGSLTRRTTDRIAQTSRSGTDLMSKLNLVNFTTNIQKRLYGTLVLDFINNNSKKLLQAASKLAPDADKAARDAALKSVGLGTRYDVARLNKMGFNTQTAIEYHRQLYKHGLMYDNSPVRAKYATFDEYLNDDAVVRPNFDDWDASTSDLTLRVVSGMANEIDRFGVVTPGVGDVPLWVTKFGTLGRLINQFQSFGFAFGNQRLTAMAQMPVKYQAGYVASYVFLGAVADATKNALSGRRSLDETARLWRDNPLGALYGAVNASGLTGWLQRPLAILDKFNTPFSPGVQLSNTQGASSSRYFAPDSMGTWLGPWGSDMERLAAILPNAANGAAQAVGMRPTGKGWGNHESAELARMWPGQNWFMFRAANKFFGVPSTPDALFPQQRARTR